MNKHVIKTLLAVAERLDPTIPCIVGGTVSAEASNDFSGDEEENNSEIKSLIYGPDPFMLIPKGERVEAHLNLGRKIKEHGLKTWSVRWKKKNNRVYGHATSVVLDDVVFRVGQRGAEKAALGDKTVHALADGTLIQSTPPSSRPSRAPPDAVQIRYNPHPPDLMKKFMRQNPETGAWDIPVAGCARLWLTINWKLMAVGVEDAE